MIDSIRDFNDRRWQINDRVRMYPHGDGKIIQFINAGLARVLFNNGLVETVPLASLVLVRRRTADEAPIIDEPEDAESKACENERRREQGF